MISTRNRTHITRLLALWLLAALLMLATPMALGEDGDGIVSDHVESTVTTTPEPTFMPTPTPTPEPVPTPIPDEPSAQPTHEPAQPSYAEPSPDPPEAALETPAPDEYETDEPAEDTHAPVIALCAEDFDITISQPMMRITWNGEAYTLEPVHGAYCYYLSITVTSHASVRSTVTLTPCLSAGTAAVYAALGLSPSLAPQRITLAPGETVTIAFTMERAGSTGLSKATVEGIMGRGAGAFYFPITAAFYPDAQ